MAESIFTSQTPALTDANDSTPYTLATLWTPAVDGVVTHGRWFFPATLPSSAPVYALYSWTSDAAGTELATATFSAPVAGTWNTVALGAIPVDAGAFYYAAVFTPDRYVASGGFFNGNTVVSGNLSAPADDLATPRRNGRFNDFGSSPNYPDTQFNGGCYFPDVVFEAGSVPDVRGSSSPSVTARRTSLAAVSASRTSTPTVTARRTSAPTVTGG